MPLMLDASYAITDDVASGLFFAADAFTFFLISMRAMFTLLDGFSAAAVAAADLRFDYAYASFDFSPRCSPRFADFSPYAIRFAAFFFFFFFSLR